MILHYVFKINKTILIVSSIISFLYFIFFIGYCSCRLKEISGKYLYGIVSHNIFLFISILILVISIIMLIGAGMSKSGSSSGSSYSGSSYTGSSGKKIKK